MGFRVFSRGFGQIAVQETLSVLVITYDGWKPRDNFNFEQHHGFVIVVIHPYVHKTKHQSPAPAYERPYQRQTSATGDNSVCWLWQQRGHRHFRLFLSTSCQPCASAHVLWVCASYAFAHHHSIIITLTHGRSMLAITPHSDAWKVTTWGLFCLKLVICW